MTYALSGLPDDDAIELLTGLRDLERSGRASRNAISEVIALIGDMGFQISTPRDDDGESQYAVGDVLKAIREQVITMPREHV